MATHSIHGGWGLGAIALVGVMAYSVHAHMQASVMDTPKEGDPSGIMISHDDGKVHPCWWHNNQSDCSDRDLPAKLPLHLNMSEDRAHPGMVRYTPICPPGLRGYDVKTQQYADSWLESYGAGKQLQNELECRSAQ